MIKKISLLVVACLFVYVCRAQKAPSEEECRKRILYVMFYNVENLFDTIDDPHKNDNDFLPDSKKKWDTKKYNSKINRIAEVLCNGKEKQFPDIVGLCEIENRKVLEDLINEKSLNKANYEIIHDESPDQRGIDNALIFNNKRFKYISHKNINVDLKEFNSKTRDILFVKGIAGKNDTLHLFVNHWPSRRGGMEKSEPKRIKAAQTLKNVVDSILKANPIANICIMGDFNDEPDNNSVYKILGAKPLDYKGGRTLCNLSYNLFVNDGGSYYYWRTKDWNMLDQFIVSSALFESKKGLRLISNEQYIFNPSWLMEIKGDEDKIPYRTFGKGYLGGYSDHLPVYIKLKL